MGTFNKEKAIVGAFSVQCSTSRMFVDSSRVYSPDDEYAEGDALRAVQQHRQRVLVVLVRQHGHVAHHRGQQVDLHTVLVLYSASKKSIRRFVITVTKPPVPYDNCTADPISR